QLRRDRMRIIAYFLAQERMEELLTFAEVFPNPQLRNETRQQVNNFTQFERQVNFTCPPTGLNADYNNLTLINVTVFWNASGRQRQFSLLSMVANFSN
ncbi:MAG: hypothetical protein N2606_02940, partial [Candidatus Omnitrophica bacterium]|nr:hypothetical protein [Candidatus Omnitrophota bacterium]